jgi:3-oxoacyl-[acyl-carrier protein] reductase
MSDQQTTQRPGQADMDWERMPRYPDIAGKIALVTGSSRGIGLATAMALAANGARVILNGRDPQRLQEGMERIAAMKGNVDSIAADFSDPNAIRRASEDIIARYGKVDILVTNAGGIGEPVPSVEETEQHWQTVVDANLTSSFLAVRAFLPAMFAQGRGSIVTVSSTAGRFPSKSSAAYAAAKAGVVMLTRHLANEVGPKGVRVNCVAPGAVLTEDGFLAKAPLEVQKQVAAMHPVGRLGRPEDIAYAILFLASECASWVTGVTMDVCGGRVTG